MSTCQVILYKNSKLYPWKNFKLDDISSYLSGFANQDKLSFAEAQFMKHSLEHTYKIQQSQEMLAYLSANNFNYLSALNSSDNKTYYYFIIAKKWLSEGCIELTLRMDVLNTILDSIQYDDKTLIKREHKNRFKKFTSPELFSPLIDFYSEGFQLPMYKTAEATILQKYDNLVEDYYETGSFYLVFRADGTNPQNPVRTFLFSDSEMTIDFGESGFNGEYDISKHPGANGDYIIIYGADSWTDSQGVSHNNVGATITDAEGHSKTITSPNEYIYINYSYLGHINLQTQHGEDVRTGGSLKFTMSGVQRVRRCTNIRWFFSNHFSTSFITSLRFDDAIHGTSGVHTIDPITSVDRTDPLLLKIIKLPYCPAHLEVDQETGNFILGTDWVFVGATTGDHPFPNCIERKNVIGLGAIESSLIPFVESEDFDINIFAPKDAHGISEFGTLVAKDPKYEPKLYHSDFYITKFVYDSFEFGFNLEYLRDDYDTFLPEFTFSVSSQMNGRFMFQFWTYAENIKVDSQSYSALLTIERNNEMAIFDSAFMDYIRNGYNYDVKTKNRQIRTNWTQFGLNLAGTVGSAVAGVVTGNPLAIGSAVALGFSTASSLVNSISTTAQLEQNIQQKLHNAEMQGVSVNTNDDIDLLSVYTEGNKAKFVRYEVSPRMKELLFDLFYFTGYIANYQGIPKLNTRKNFNFIMADVVIRNSANFPVEITNEIVSKYKEGITFLHYMTALSGYDFEQQYENWESNVRAFIPQEITTIQTEREYVISGNSWRTASSRTKQGKLIFRKIHPDTLEIIETHIVNSISFGLGVFGAENYMHISGDDYTLDIPASQLQDKNYTIEFIELGTGIGTFVKHLMGYIA